jgi:type IV pilus assembly protein PilM
MLDSLKRLVQEPPPSMAFEISESGIAAARLVPNGKVEFRPLKPGVLSVSPLRENVIEAGEFAETVRALWSAHGSRKHRDVAVILPDYATRIAVLDFDQFPSDAKEQASLVRFRLKRSVPYDVEGAVLSYFAQTGPDKKCDVLTVLAPLEIVARYEAPFRSAGMNPGLVTTSTLAALELAPVEGLSVLAKLTGHILTVVVREKSVVKLVRCVEVASQEFDDIAAVLLPTFVYVEDNLGRAADSLLLCGFGAQLDAARRRLHDELGVAVEPLRSTLGTAGENNAGLLGYLHSITRN